MRPLVLLLCFAAAYGYSIRDNEIFETPRVRTSDDLLDSVADECIDAESTLNCLKGKVLAYLDTQLGVEQESARALEEQNIDKVILDRVGRLVKEREFRVQMPEFLFQGVEVTYRSDRGLDFDFPETDGPNGEARGLLKKKLLLPVLLLLKLKMKALMPLLVTIMGIKAIKAFLLSKVAVILVGGFIAYNLFMKKGAMPMMMAPSDPSPQYGPPATAYGAPGNTPAASDSYNAQWEPTNGGPYARVGWDPASLAYNSYVPNESQNSPSYSQVASISSSSSSTTN